MKIHASALSSDMEYSPCSVSGLCTSTGNSKKVAVNTHGQVYETVIELHEFLETLSRDKDSATEISLGFNSYSQPVLQGLVEAVDGCVGVCKLCLARVFTGWDEQGALPELELLCYLIEKLKGLVELDLSGNSLPGCVMDLLCHSFGKGLKVLCLDDNNLQSEGAVLLSDFWIKNNSELRVFSAANNRLGDEGAVAIARGLKRMQSLRELKLAGNRIGGRGLIAISNAIVCNTQLSILDLQDNFFNDHAALKVLRQTLFKMKYMKSLNFSDCSLGSKGARILIESVQFGAMKLKRLCLNYNQIIDPNVVKKLFSVVKDKESIEYVEVIGNDIDYNFIVEFLNGIERKIYVEVDESRAVSQDDLYIKALKGKVSPKGYFEFV